MGHPPRIPVWLRWEQSVVYFVTICVADRKSVLANDHAFIAFKKAAARLRDWTVLAAILMPDHLHIVATPIADRDAKVGIFLPQSNAGCVHSCKLHGNGNPVVLIGFFVRTSRYATNGSTSKKIRSGLGS